MSFDCKYKSDRDFCERLKGGCRPGTPGCVLYGRFTFADTQPAAPKKKNPGKTSPGTLPSSEAP